MSTNIASSTQETIDAVLLDAGGVLILPEHDAMRAALASFEVVPADAVLTRAHYAGMAARDAAAEQEPAWSAYARAYVAACGVTEQVDAAAAVLFEARPEWISATGAARDHLAGLADLGVALAVVSNSVGTVARQLAAAGVCQVGAGPGIPVRAVIDSHLVGVHKPDAEIFRLGLDAVGCAPERALMVGDYVHADVQGAERLGIRSAHIDPYGDCGVAHAGPDLSLGAVVGLVRDSRA